MEQKSTDERMKEAVRLTAPGQPLRTALDMIIAGHIGALICVGDTEAVLAACAGRVIGADVCGDVSGYEYASPFKRFLSRLDGQEPCDPQALRGWQEGQRAVNAALLESLGKVLREPEASTRVSPILRRFF